MPSLHIAELASSLRQALEPQRKPDMLVSFGRWALVQRESLAVRAASPMAVAVVSFSFDFHFKKKLFRRLFRNRPAAQPLLSLFSLSPLPPTKKPGRARYGLRPGSPLRVPPRRLQARKETKGGDGGEGEDDEGPRCLFPLPGRRRRGNGHGLPALPLRSRRRRRRCPQEAAAAAARSPVLRRGPARRPPAPRGREGEGARRGRGGAREEGGRGAQGRGRGARIETGSQPEDPQGRRRRARGGFRAAADADACQRPPEERARRRRRRSRRRRDCGVQVFREPAACDGLVVGGEGFEGRAGARCRVRERVFRSFKFPVFLERQERTFCPSFPSFALYRLCQLLQKK